MVATISLLTKGSSQQTLAEVGDNGGPRFAAQEGREHQHQPARRRTDLPKAPLENNVISDLDVWDRSRSRVQSRWALVYTISSRFENYK